MLKHGPQRKKGDLTRVDDVPLLAELDAHITLTIEEPGREAIEIVQRMQEVTQATPRAKDALPSAELADPGEEFCQLDLWPEPERGSPNAFLRSALFAAIQSEHRERIEGTPAKRTEEPPPVPIVSQKGLSISYKGKQLDQYDLDVWLQAIHWARRQPLGKECTFPGHAFLEEIGRTRGKINYDLLTESLTRLTAGLVVIKQGDVTFTGHLVSHFLRDDQTRQYKVTFAEEILKLFGRATFTRLQCNERRNLKGKALALWLHGYYSSHAKPYPVTVDYLYKLCGSRNAAKRSFRAKLKKAFEDLEKVTSIHGTIEGDMVIVERKPSPAQAKHIADHSTSKA